MTAFKSQSIHKFSVSINKDITEMDRIRKDFCDYLKSENLSLIAVEEWKLIFTEMVCNAIRHGGRKANSQNDRLIICWGRNKGKMELSVSDAGKGPMSKLKEFNPLPSDLYSDSGRGIFLVEHYADAWVHVAGPSGYTFKVYKRT